MKNGLVSEKFMLLFLLSIVKLSCTMSFVILLLIIQFIPFTSQ